VGRRAERPVPVHHPPASVRRFGSLNGDMAVVYRFQVVRKVVALTFDDGPDPVWTAELLAVLGDEDVRATFFALGCWINSETRPILRGALTSGHDIGNHTFAHRSFAQPSLSDASASDEIVRTHVLLSEIGDAQPTLIRPPFGHAPERVDRLAFELGYRVTVMYEEPPAGDWDQPPAHRILQSVVDSAKPGSIIQLHDGCDPTRRGQSRRETVEAVRRLIPALRAQGFEFATVTELLNEAKAHSNS
jgi:peptidoglycan/xylan/chitin deacetylase (PgdA/CDA1 family)